MPRCAIYTRKSTEEGLEQDFNSLHAQREACEAFIKSQRHEGWRLVRTAFDDGGYSGGTMKRPALQQLLDAIERREVDIIVVYKVDRLTRSLSPQPVNATHALNLSAGVSNPNVLRGRSLSCLATLFSSA